MNFLKGVFNFFVGDWIILIGVILSFLSVVMLQTSFGNLKEISGFLFVIGIVTTLGLSLYRETHH